MEAISWILLLVVVVATWLFFNRTRSTSADYIFPPGPRGLPFIGCPWLLLNEFHKSFTKLGEEWGEILSFKIFGQHLVVLNSHEVIREAFTSGSTGEVFAGRPPLPADPEKNLTTHMTTWSQPDPLWDTQRKLVHKILNIYGDGLQPMEDKVHGELNHVSEWLMKNKEEAIDLDSVLYPSLINMITILLIGRRGEYDSKILGNVRKMDEASAKLGSQRNMILIKVFPFIRYIPTGIGRLYMDCKNSQKQFVKDFFDDQKATYEPEVTRGMVDHLIHQQDEQRKEGGNQWLTDTIIKAVTLEMVGAGSITTRGALAAFFLIVTAQPEVAKKIQTEIDEVCPRRLPSLKDRSKMHYTMAAILELLRYISHAALAIPHATTDDVTFREYRLPAKTTVMANLWSVHHDEATWSDPWVFRPQRFLGEDCTLLPADHILRKSAMPFGVGRRSCVGELFARSRIFLFVTALLQKFDFTPDPAQPLPSTDPRDFIGGLVLSPPKYYVMVKPRGFLFFSQQYTTE